MESRKRAALGVVISGVVTIISVVLMRAMAGAEIPPHDVSNADGFRSTMVWFELALTRDEVMANLGPVSSTQGPARRHQLDVTNYYDFGFMVCYSLFNACLIYFVTHLNIYRFRELLQLRVFMVLGFILSAAMLVGDIIENQQLLELTKAHDADGILVSTISSLIYWTRVKWGSIFVVALMLCSGYTAYFRRVPTLLLPAIYAVAGIAGLVAISVPMARPMLETIGTPAIALAWASSLIHATVFLIRRHDEFPLPTNHRNRQTSPVEASA